ncbi:hypothetical protein [Microbulbifer sp. VAAF005]|uniref:hypothetical protein n=1 Tax=Microbulbifer sp. VAAF005 TaxID=3034230 RepID=UPI0024AD52D9|nr:hypothetical protein [Microbulbifer sp. VAAF005]WHI44683.1 hypothetical protein P0078_13095 [Microbulbifer sp. VAAF005]
MAIKCPECKSKNVDEVFPFSFSKSRCPDCGFEYILSIWYRLSVHTFLWSVLIFLVIPFNFIASADNISNTVGFTLIGLMMICPMAYWYITYTCYRVETPNRVSKTNFLIFWVLTVATYTPAVIYMAGSNA